MQRFVSGEAVPLWKEDAVAQWPAVTAKLTQRQQVSDAAPCCKCSDGATAVVRTVRKAGRNQGKFFFSCPKPMKASCNFFEWCPEQKA